MSCGLPQGIFAMRLIDIRMELMEEMVNVPLAFDTK
jgi:hypothetical protein